MDKNTAEIIRTVLVEELDKRGRIDQKLHSEHHATIQEWLDSGLGDYVRILVEREKSETERRIAENERRKARTDLYRAVQQQVITWSILGLLSYLITDLWPKIKAPHL